MPRETKDRGKRDEIADRTDDPAAEKEGNVEGWKIIQIRFGIECPDRLPFEKHFPVVERIIHKLRFDLWGSETLLEVPLSSKLDDCIDTFHFLDFDQTLQQVIVDPADSCVPEPHTVQIDSHGKKRLPKP
jgi:hypothetical protein